MARQNFFFFLAPLLKNFAHHCSKRSVQVWGLVKCSNSVYNTNTSYISRLYSRRAVWTQHTRTATISYNSNWEGMYRQPTATAYPLCVQLYTFSHNIRKVIKTFSVDADIFLRSFIKFKKSVAMFKTSQKAIINLRSSKGSTRRIKI